MNYNFKSMLHESDLKTHSVSGGLSHIEFENASIGYPGAIVLENINLKIPPGSQVAVVGPNGAGKSTLFKALVGLIPLLSGDIRVHGLSVASHHDCIAYIPQREEVDWKFPVTVRDVVAMGRFGKQGLFRRESKADKEIINEALHRLNIEELAAKPIGNLSGGQQQRAFLARAIAQQPHILILDEPFNGVDVNTHQVILNLLISMKLHDVTILVSTHDLNLAAEKFEKVILLNKKMIYFGDPEQAFTQDNLQIAFGKQILLLNNKQSILVDECCPTEDKVNQV